MDDELEDKLNAALHELSVLKKKYKQFHFCLSVCMVDDEDENFDNVVGEVAISNMNYQTFETIVTQIAEAFQNKKSGFLKPDINNLTYEELITIWGNHYNDGEQFN